MGRRKQRMYEARFKEAAVRRMLNGESIMRLSREFDVARAVLYRWRDTYRPRAWQVWRGGAGGRVRDSKR